MKIDNNEEALDFINRLLEQLHQADYKVLGSIVLNVYKAGSQHVDHVDNQYFYGISQPQAKGRVKEARDLPEALATEAAMALWEKAQKAGYVDENYQPLISRTQSALLADAMAERLGIREKWKVFEALWNRKNMYCDYYQALGQRKTLAFQDELKKMCR